MHRHDARAALLPGGTSFLASYHREFGPRDPDPYAIYGYEAMRLGLDTIAGLGAHGDRREAVRRALFHTHHRASVLGSYSITRTGDTTLRAYGVYRADRHGRLVFDHTVRAR